MNEYDISYVPDVEVGDKILCKKTLLGKNDYLLVEGKTYDVIKKVTQLWIVVKDEQEHFLNISISVFSSASPLQFVDYFYTKQEHRKIKLEKLK